MTPTIQEHVAAVEAAYLLARGQWDGWDWPASFGAGAEGCAIEEWADAMAAEAQAGTGDEADQ